MEQKREKIFFGAGMLFLTFMCVCFWAVGATYVLLALTILCVAEGIFSKKIFLDKESVLLLTGMFIYSVISQVSVAWVIKLTLLPFLFYYYGKIIIMLHEQTRREQRSKVIIIVLSLGLFIGSVLNAVSWQQYGFENGRAWKEFWTGQRLPATQHVFWSLLIVALVFYGGYYWKKSRFVNSVLVLGGLWSVWFSLLTGSRIIVLVFGIVFLVNIILYCYFKWSDERKRGYIIKGLIGVVIVSVLLVVAYTFNIGGVFTPIKESYMWTRNGGILHNVRFQAQIAALKQLFQYPFGGNHMEVAGLSSTHNVWLNIANTAGLLPFILIVIYTIFTGRNLIKLVRMQNASQEIKYLLISAYISLFLYYMVEPALDANVMYWSVWMLVCGLVKGNVDI